MQDDVSRKRALLPSPAMVVAIIALVLATAGSTFAVAKSTELPPNSVGSKQLKPKAVTTGKIANNAVKSNNIVDHSLTGDDINVKALGTVPSAANADQTGNAGTITGHAAACPGGTTLIRGVCFDSASNPPADTLTKARDACAAKGGYLPSPLELYAARGVLNLGTGVGTDLQYTDTYYDNTAENATGEIEIGADFEGKVHKVHENKSPSTITVDGQGTLTEQSVNDPAEFTCIYPLVR
jgi:hypothetical protein